MTERDPLATLDRLLDDVPVRPLPERVVSPVGPIGSDRRRRLVVLAAAAAVVLVLGAGVVGERVLGGDDEGGTFAASPEVRPVGIGRVTIEVPTGWTADATGCGQDGVDVVHYPSRRCASSSFVFSSAVLVESTAPRIDLRPAGEVGGFAVRKSDPVCDSSPNPLCSRVFGVPDLGAWFTVIVPPEDHEQLDEIPTSLAVLPEGQTTVPAPARRGVEAYRERLVEAGFRVVVEAGECSRVALCASLITDVEPTVGSVAPVGSTVVVTKL